MKRSWTKEEMLENAYQYDKLSKYNKEKADFVENTLSLLITELSNHITKLYYIYKNYEANEEEQDEEYVYYYNSWTEIYGRVCITCDNEVDIVIDVIKHIFKR